MHWSFEDPAAVTGTLAEREAAFRKVRDQIAAKLREFAARAERARQRIPGPAEFVQTGC
jgi:hypothetical protein